MSRYTDPTLFIYHWNSSKGCRITRIVKKYNVPLQNGGDIDYLGKLDFSEHLSLGNNKESDYDAFKSLLAKNSYEANREKVMFVNCQGLVVYFDYSKSTGTWSRVDEHDESIFYSLPGFVINPSVTVLAEKLQAIEKLNSELVIEISSLKDKFQQELNQEKNYREALEKKVLDMSIKLQESRGSGDAEPWMNGGTVPSNWVPLEELDVLNIAMDAPLTIIEAPGVPELGEDTTTNVQANHFCRGIFPIVVVNVEDLSPNNGKARFNPDIWCSINSAGKFYAARKPAELETTFDQHMG